MINVYNVYQKLHGNEKVDEFTKQLCREFLSRHPLKWIESFSKEYAAIDEDGRDYVFIRNRDGKFFIREGCYFDGTFPLGLKVKTDSLAEAIESANEILRNVGFFVHPYNNLEPKNLAK